MEARWTILCRHLCFSPKEILSLPGPTLPRPLQSAGSLPYGDSFIVVGGRYDSFTYSEAVYMYDIEDENWIELDAALQVPRGFFGIAAANREAVGC